MCIRDSMLTGDSGSGKSSLSTILMNNNFSLVADDFSPMSISGNHYNFPSAISIKEGFYKSANERQVYTQRMQSLYEDMGNILNRYFEINGELTDEQK